MNGVITSDMLYLFQINSDNSSSSTLLSSTTQNEAQFPGAILSPELHGQREYQHSTCSEKREKATDP